jgi:hydroxymethylbilane synthase
MTFRLRIGTRPSALALAQTEIVKRRLEEVLEQLTVEVVPIRTSGDKMATAALARVGGKGLFIRELEQALADDRIDLAVHSMKDLPAVIPAGFRIAAVPERENPRDALITRGGLGWSALAAGARLGTSSTRRRLEALRVRPDLAVMPLRGNVDTRLRRLEAGDFDAIILAMAGLKRLGRGAGMSLTELDEREFVPCGGQGALAIEARADRTIGDSADLERAVATLDDARALAEVTAERAFLATIGASCVSPVGVKGTADGDTIRLRALLFSVDGLKSLFDEVAEPHNLNHPAATVGVMLGQRMLERGAAALIQHE